MIADDEEDPYADTAAEAEDAEFDKGLFGAQAPEPTVAPPIEQTVSSPSAEQLYAPSQSLLEKPISEEELAPAPSKAPPQGVEWAGDAFTLDKAPTGAAPTGAAPADGPTPKGVQWAGDAFTLGAPAEEKPPEARGLLGDAWTAIKRYGVDTFYNLADLGNLMDKGLAWATGDEFRKHKAEEDDTLIKQRREEFAKTLAPTVKDFEEAVKDPSKIPSYVADKFGAVVPMIVAYATAGVPMMALAGIATGAKNAYDQNNGDIGATLTGGALGGVMASLPAPFLKGAAGKSLVENIVRATVGMPIVTTAGALAEPLPKRVAGGDYDWPSAWKLADAAVAGAIGGAAMGPVGYYHSRGRTPEVPPIEGGGKFVDPDHQAALDEAARAKGTPPEGTPGGPPTGLPIPPAGTPEPTQQGLPLERSPTLPFRPAEAPVGRPGVSQPELPGTAPVQPNQPPLPGTAEPLGPRRVPLGEAAEEPVGTVERPVVPPSERGPVGPPVTNTAEGWTVHPDPSGGHVVRNANGDAIALGDTPQQAVEFARARAVPPDIKAAMDATQAAPPEPTGPRPPEPVPIPPAGGPAPEQPILPMPEQQLPLRQRSSEPPVGRPGEAQPELPGTRPLQPDQPSLPGTAEPLGPRRVPLGEAAEEPVGRVARPTEPVSERGPIGPAPREAGWTVERDHTGPGHVVKNADGNVIAVGDTPQQAMEFARARSAEHTAARAEYETRKAEAEAAAQRKPGRLVKGEAPAEKPTTVVEKPATVGEQLKAQQAAKVTEKVAPAQTKGEQLRAKRAAEKARLAAEKAAAPARGKVHVAEPTPEEEAPAKTPGLTSLLRKRQSRMADEARQEAEGQETRLEQEGAPAEETVEPAEKTRSAQTTNLPRIAEDLVGDILSGEKTHVEAHEEYGTEKPGRGNKRTYPEIADYIEDRVNAATDETGTHVPKIKTMPTDQAIMDRARKLQQRVNRRDPTLTPASKAAQERAINAALERNREVRERADELRAMVDELRGGAKESKAADLETLMEKLQRQTEQLKRGEELEAPLGDSRGVIQRFMDRARANTAVRRLFHAPEINKPLQDMIRRDGRGGLGSSAHDYLDAIINNSMSRSLVPHAVELARQLKRILPPEVRMMTQETGRDLFDRPIKEGAAGSYSPALDTIFINSKLAGDDYAHITNATVNTLHEGLHGGTYHYIEHLLDAEQGRTLTPIEKRHLDAFRAIDEAVQHIRDEPPRRLSDVENLSLAYANKDLHELTTMLMTDPIVHDVVRGVDASPELRRGLNRLGYGVKPKASVWDAFKNVMSRVLRLSGATANGDFFDHVMSPMTEIIEAAGAYRRSREAEIRAEAEENQAVDMIRKMAKDEGTSPLAVFERVRGKDSPLDLIPDARQREAVRPLDEHLQELDAPLHERSKDALGRFWMNTLREAATWTNRKTRQGALLAAPRNSVVSHNEDIFRSRDPDAPGAKPLQDWQAADQAVWRATQHEQETYADRINNLVRRMVGPERMDIARLMNDVGYAKVHLGAKDVAADNPHIEAGSDQAKEMHRLNDVYNNLSAQAQETYQGYKQYYRETYAKERKAEFESIVKKALPDITPTAQKALAEQVTTLKKINELIRAPDKTPLQEAFAERWQHDRAMVREIAKAQRAGFVEGDYFPHRRYGDYVITYGNKDSPDYGVEMFETSTAAEARRQEILDEKKVDVSPVFLKSAHEKAIANVPRQLIDQLDAAIKQKGLGTEQAETVRQAMLGLMLKNGTNQAAFRMRREGVKGAALEPERTLVRDYLAYTSRMGYLLHGGERADAMQGLERHYRRMREQGDGQITTHAQAAAAQTKLAELRKSGTAEADPAMMAARKVLNRSAPAPDIARARDVIDSLKARSAPIDGDMSSDLVGKMARGFNTISAVYQLIRPAHLAVQIIDTHAKAESYIGARHGFGAAALALSKAVKDLAPRAAMTGGKAMYRAVTGQLKVADWDMTSLSRDRLIAANPKDKAGVNQLMDELDATGTLTHTRAREMQRLSRPGAFDFAGRTGSAIGNLPGNLMNMMSVAEHTMDHMNRVAVAKAAFDLELRRFGNVDQAVKYGVAEALKAQPDYTPGNKPPMSMQHGPAGRLAAPAMLYKMYGMHTYSVMANLVKNAATGAERAEAVKALAATLAIHSMLIGVLPSLFGVPVNAVLGAWDWVTGKDEPHDYETDMMNSISDLFGPTAARFAARGLLGMGGVDLHRSLKLSNMTDITGPKSFDAKGWGGAVLTAMTGASGSQAYQFADAFHNLFSGNYGKATTQFLPRIARDAVQGYRAATEGIKDPRGVSVIKPQDISAFDVGAKVLGFNPSTWANVQDKRAKVAEFERELHADRRHAEDAYTRAYQAHDMSTAFKVLKAYNDMHPNARITSAEMASQMKGIAKRSNDPRFGGLNIPKKQQNEALRAIRGFGP